MTINELHTIIKTELLAHIKNTADLESLLASLPKVATLLANYPSQDEAPWIQEIVDAYEAKKVEILETALAEIENNL